MLNLMVRMYRLFDIPLSKPLGTGGISGRTDVWYVPGI